jgi:hypothetical protein
MMKKNNNDFNFKFRKTGRGKIVSFDVSQIEHYRIEARCDFIPLFLSQLSCANKCEILLEWELQIIFAKWIDEVNEKNKENKTAFLELHIHRAIIDYCLHSINLSVITDFRTIMSMLEFYYEQKENSAIKQFV